MTTETFVTTEAIISQILHEADDRMEIRIGRHSKRLKMFGYYASLEHFDSEPDYDNGSSWTQSGHGFTIHDAVINLYMILHQKTIPQPPEEFQE